MYREIRKVLCDILNVNAFFLSLSFFEIKVDAAIELTARLESRYPFSVLQPPPKENDDIVIERGDGGSGGAEEMREQLSRTSRSVLRG